MSVESKYCTVRLSDVTLRSASQEAKKSKISLADRPLTRSPLLSQQRQNILTMAAINRPTEATYVTHEEVTVDTSGMPDQ
jgi:hypothetical protein